jgi:hypothetical protein
MDDQKLERIELKLDKAADHLAAIDITLTAQHVSLDEHIKRSNMLEAKLIPVERHVWMVNGALKLLGAASLMVGLIEGLRLLLK